MEQKPRKYRFAPKPKTYRDYLKEAASRDHKNYGYYVKKISNKQKANSLIINHV